MRTADVLRTALGGVAVLALSTGCGSNMGGTATTTSTTKSADDLPIFNPCTQLNDDVLQATGLDPATKRVVTDPPEGPSAWRICAWRSRQGPYRIDVASTSHTQAESRTNQKLTGLRDVPIGPRVGLIYKDKTNTEGDSCYASLPAAQGMFEVSAFWYGDATGAFDVCELAMRHAQDLEPSLPK